MKWFNIGDCVTKWESLYTAGGGAISIDNMLWGISQDVPKSFKRGNMIFTQEHAFYVSVLRNWLAMKTTDVHLHIFYNKDCDNHTQRGSGKMNYDIMEHCVTF